MLKRTVTVTLQTADRTRKAEVTVPRSMRTMDLIKASTNRWSLAFGVDYQIANVTRGVQLFAHDTLTEDKVCDGDVLMIQAFPTHGGVGAHG